MADSNTCAKHPAPQVKALLAQNTAALDAFLAQGWNINKRLPAHAYGDDYPIHIALKNKKYKSLDWLLAHQVQINIEKDSPLVAACQYCNEKTIRLLLDRGADVHGNWNNTQSALTALIDHRRYALMPLLLEYGYDLAQDGWALRQAVDERSHKAIDFLLAHGANPNFCQPDMVWPYNSSPLLVAAENNDLKTVKKLLAHGASALQKDDYGQRPYLAALENGNTKMAALFKQLEPPLWHDEEQRLVQLAKYNMPPALVALLRADDAVRRIELPGNPYMQHMVLAPLLQVREVNWQGHKFLDLLQAAQTYSPEGLLVWYPRKKCLAFADYEHGDFKLLGNWAAFEKDPSALMKRIFE